MVCPPSLKSQSHHHFLGVLQFFLQDFISLYRPVTPQIRKNKKKTRAEMQRYTPAGQSYTVPFIRTAGKKPKRLKWKVEGRGLRKPYCFQDRAVALDDHALVLVDVVLHRAGHHRGRGLPQGLPPCRGRGRGRLGPHAPPCRPGPVRPFCNGHRVTPHPVTTRVLIALLAREARGVSPSVGGGHWEKNPDGFAAFIKPIFGFNGMALVGATRRRENTLFVSAVG